MQGEVSIQNISYRTGNIVNGTRAGQKYELFILKLGAGNKFACGGGIRPGSWRLDQQTTPGAIWDLLKSCELEPEDSATKLEEGAEAKRVKMSDLKSKILANAKKEAMEDGYTEAEATEMARAELRAFMAWNTHLFDHKTGQPEHGCQRFTTKLMPLGKDDEEFYLMTKDNDVAVRHIRGVEIPIKEKAVEVWILEAYDAPTNTWTQYKDEELLLAEQRERYKPLSDFDRNKDDEEEDDGAGDDTDGKA